MNEFFFAFVLLSFAALLCLFGVVVLTDGSIRLIMEWRRRLRPKTVSATRQEDKVTTLPRAA